MEVKESERVVIVKPIASKPSCTTIKTFTQLLSDSVTVDASIRPKTLRFKQPAAASVLCPQVEGNGNRKACDDPENRKYVIYKPKAKLVSKATVSALANMLQGNQQQTWRQSKAVRYGKSVSQATHRPGPNLVPRVPSFTESETSIGDRSSMDGYNWRKYGQKQVKGSDYPRSYYKCTYPKCPVKKRVERSMRGQVSEIVYQGEHNHSKPSEGSMRQEPQSNDSPKTITEKMNEGCVITPFEFAVPRSCDEGELDDQGRSKRRKNEKQSSQSSGESDGLEDGFKWRKYGQKVVGGNAYPRSYYRCTSVNCRARKHVERASDDPRAFITTYEGKHNHHLLLSTLPISSTQHSHQAI